MFSTPSGVAYGRNKNLAEPGRLSRIQTDDRGRGERSDLNEVLCCQYA